MSTQIFIQGQSGCTTDSMAIASSSGKLLANGALQIGGERGWNAQDLNTPVSIQVGYVPIAIDTTYMASGVPLPRDLFVGDKITLCGTANLFPFSSAANPNQLRLMVGIYYLNCSNPTQNTGNTSTIDLYKMVSTQLFPFERIAESEGHKSCFTIEYNVDQLYAGCDTLIYLVFGVKNIFGGSSEAQCCITYSLNNERNCLALDTTPFLRIQSCCDQTVEEVIFNPDLSVGQSFVDNEGNCWEVVEKTADPVTGSRIVDTTYTTCEQCKSANPCPNNLVVALCCTGGIETFTASLPGVNVGDIFVDIYGICYEVISDTEAPITGYVTVDTNYGPQDCGTCTELNACPTFIALKPCCDYFGELIVTLDTLLGYNPGNNEVIVDTFGVCYRQKEYLSSYGSVNAPFIQYASSYGVNGCNDCIDDNPCSPLYYTLIDCCNGDIEVVLIDTGGSLLTPDTVIELTFTDLPLVRRCFKVLSYSNTGVATKVLDKIVDISNSCQNCRSELKCLTNYIIQDCCGILPNEVATLTPYELNGSVSFSDAAGNCWSIVEETTDPATVVLIEAYKECDQCNRINENCTLVSLISCCTTADDNQIMEGVTSLESLGGGVVVGDTIKDQFGVCWRVEGPRGYSANLGFITTTSVYADCESCGPCPTAIYYSFKNCCSGVIETILIDYSQISFYVPTFLINAVYTLVTNRFPNYSECFEFIGYNTTGVETLTLIGFDGNIYSPGNCDVCVAEIQTGQTCYNYYEVEACDGITPNGVMYLPDSIFANNQIVKDINDGFCWTPIAVTTGPHTLLWDGNIYNNCSECTA